MPDRTEKPTPPPRSADALAATASELLNDVVRTTAAGERPATPQGQALLERLRSTFDATAADAATPEAARAIVAVALDRVPVALRGTPLAWEAMLDAVAGKLFESDGARAHLDALMRSLRAASPETL